MAMKGFQEVAAMITISELGDLTRFNHPRQLMAFLGSGPERREHRNETSPGRDHEVRKRARALVVDRKRPGVSEPTEGLGRN